MVEVIFSEYVASTSLYSNYFNALNFSEELIEKGVNYKKGLLKITDFGKNFIDICLSWFEHNPKSFNKIKISISSASDMKAHSGFPLTVSWINPPF